MILEKLLNLAIFTPKHGVRTNHSAGIISTVLHESTLDDTINNTIYNTTNNTKIEHNLRESTLRKNRGRTKPFFSSLLYCNCTRLFIVLINILLFSSHLLTNNALANNDTLIRVATTTSTENSGLLKYLTPKFEAKTGYKLHFIAAGTGKALQMGRDGDVDLMLVHAKSAEDKVVAEGYGVKRYPLMYNDFVIVGPKKSVNSFADKTSIQEVLEAIAQTKRKFISRGDDSGTHKKELSLWKTTKAMPNNKTDRWYIEAGQGMGKVLQMTGELDAYTMTDRGTWLAYMHKVPLSIVFEGNPILLNPYGIIAVNPEKHPDTNITGAQVFIDWMISSEGQALIGNFKISGKILFIPNATPTSEKDAA